MANDKHNNRGQILEDFFSEMNLCVLNNGSTAYVPPTPQPPLQHLLPH